MGNIFYAVKKGRKQGIFTSLIECENQVKGFSGSDYRRFKRREDAVAYLGQEKEKITADKKLSVAVPSAVAYLDSAFKGKSGTYAYGVVILFAGRELHFAGIGNDPESIGMARRAGELEAAKKVMAFAVEQEMERITIHYTYEGIAKLCTGESNPQNAANKAYKRFFDLVKNKVSITFVQNIEDTFFPYQERALRLAHDILNSQVYENVVQPKVFVKQHVWKIYESLDGLMEICQTSGEKLWSDFTLESMTDFSGHRRCRFSVDGKRGWLDFRYAEEGPIELVEAGDNQELSVQLADDIFQGSRYQAMGSSVSKSLVVKHPIALKLIRHLDRQDDIKRESTVSNNPICVKYKYVGKKRDVLFVDVYDDGGLILQGDKAELYELALMFFAENDVKKQMVPLQTKKLAVPKEVKGNVSQRQIVIDIEQGNLPGLIKEAGLALWSDFELHAFNRKNNFTRCTFTTNKKRAVLDFHHSKGKNELKLIPCGKHPALGLSLAEKLVEEKGNVKSVEKAKSYPFKLSDTSQNALIAHLDGLAGVDKKVTELKDGITTQILYVSDSGDNLYVNMNGKSTLVLQGRPRYLYMEAISFLGNQADVTRTDIVAANDLFYEIDESLPEVRVELAKLMPHAYLGVDETIIKLLSPAISMKDVDVELEDFSMFAYPVLLALEGYLKFLLGKSGIEITQNLGEVFQRSGTKYRMKPTVRVEVADVEKAAVLVEVYGYWSQQRHSLFHAQHDVAASRILKNKQEADVIVREVIQLIETTYRRFTEQTNLRRLIFKD